MSEDPRISEIRAVLDEFESIRARFQVDTTTSYGPRFLNRIRAILDRPAPGPRVFFPGDTVPVDLWVINDKRSVFVGLSGDWQVMFGPCVELFGIPSPEEWQAAVDQARAEREDGAA